MKNIHNTLKLGKEKKNRILIAYSFTIIILSATSCGKESESSRRSDSRLIDKINAVQQQLMRQGNITKNEELAMSGLCSLMSRNDDFDDYGRDDVILFKNIENAPIYNVCGGLPKEENKKCFKESVSKFIRQEFNSDIINALNLSEPQQVEVFFIIDENGNLSGMKIRDTELTIQAEIARVLKKIPKMKPAIQDKISMPVLCSMLLTYESEISIEFIYIPSGPTAKN